MNNDLQLILNYLNNKRGFDFSGYRSSMIERRLEQRLSALKLQNHNEYLHHLHEHSDELDHLVDRLTINVSRFFRDTLVFEYVYHRILPAIIFEKKRLGDDFLRVWTAGCSTGEEPYSIAILIKELFKKEKIKVNVSIFATDIDAKALKKANKAVYSYESIGNVKYRLLKRYFTAAGKSFRLIPEITNLVTLTLYDMLDKRSYVPPESIFGNFDIVFCRNVLIYFTAEYQDIIFDKLYRSLTKGGYLVLGEAEAPIMKYNRHFRKVNECCHIYQKF